MSEHRFFKAQAIYPGKPVADATLMFHATIPESDDIEVARTVFLVDTARLADVIMDTLPGGTIDALLAELMQRRASLLRVPFGRVTPDEDQTVCL